MKIAQIQMNVSADKSANIARACNMIRWAGNIDMAVLPEMFCCPYDNSCFGDYAEAEGGEAYQAMSAVAKEKGIYLVGGSIPELCEGKLYNTCYVFDPEGKCIARHRKTHLFDIDVEGGQSFREIAEGSERHDLFVHVGGAGAVHEHDGGDGGTGVIRQGQQTL